MKYYIAVDKGLAFKNQERFISLKLNDKDNNLEALCKYTMEFSDERELKQYLFSNRLITKEQCNYELKIVYYRDYYRKLNIPYKGDKAYFNMEHLNNIINKNIHDKSFAYIFLKHFENQAYKPEEYYELVKAIQDGIDYKIFDKIRGLTYKLCYKNGKISYRSLFDLAMFVSFIIKRIQVEKESKSNYKSNVTHELSEEQEFEREQMKERYEKNLNNDQLSLFR